MNNINQIAAEAADKLYNAWINSGGWTQAEMLDELRESFKSTIEKAYAEGFVHGRSNRRFCTCDESASDVIVATSVD